MFGWRRRKQGFEWREYVRTTILVRRRQRRERLAEAGQSAVQGLKDAGVRGAVAGAEGAKILGRGAVAAGQQGAVLGVVGARSAGQNMRRLLAAMRNGAVAAGRYLRIGLAYSWIGLCAAGRGLRAALMVLWVWLRAAGRALLVGLGVLWAWLRVAGRTLLVGLGILWVWLCVAGRAILAGLVILWAWLGVAASWLVHALGAGLAWMRRVLAPAFSALRSSGVSLPLAIVGGVAFLGGGGHIIFNGFSSAAVVIFLFGAVVLGGLLVARLENGSLPWISALFSRVGSGVGAAARGIGQLLPGGRLIARGAAISIGLIAVAAGGWFLVQNVPALSLPSMPSFELASEQVKGRARAVSGDALKISGKVVQLDGIEAPERGQLCLRGKSRRWRCGAAAKTALSRLVRRKQVTCELSGTDDRDRPTAKCLVGETDIAAALVQNGHVFAMSGLFAPYDGLEDEAREAKRGIWRGKADRPSEFRAQKWQQASQNAPEGCPIKGNVSRGRRVYVLPWSRNYDRVRINRKRGERWFCSEDEAVAAGWKPNGQS